MKPRPIAGLGIGFGMLHGSVLDPGDALYGAVALGAAAGAQPARGTAGGRSAPRPRRGAGGPGGAAGSSRSGVGAAPGQDRLPLADAVRRHAERFAEEHEIELQLDLVPEPPRLSPEGEVCLLRAAQEALRNAVRHGEAARVAVRLWCADEQVVLTVRDDGRGFDPTSLPAAAPERGTGLPTMKARAERLGGRLEICSTPGAGTELRVQLPAGGSAAA